MTDTAFIMCLVNLGFTLICSVIILYAVSEMFKIHLRNHKSTLDFVLQEVIKHENEEAKKDD